MLAWLAALLLIRGADAAIVARVPLGKLSPGFDTSQRLVSADAYHFAYLTVEEEVEVWYKDGRKIDTAPRGGFPDDEDDMGRAMLKALLSPQRGRFAWVKKAAGGEAVFLDGAKLGVYERVRHLAFSETGAHLAFAARIDGRWRVIVGKRPGTASFDEAPSRLKVNADGSHVVFLNNLEKYRQELWLDDRRLKPWPSSTLVMSKDWKQVGATTYDKAHIDDAEYGPYDYPHELAIAPSGGAFAFITNGPSKQNAVILNGSPVGFETREGPYELHFSPLGKLHWFGKRAEGAPCLHYVDGGGRGGWEYCPQTKPAIAFSPADVPAFLVYHDSNYRLIVDQKEHVLGKANLYPDSGLSFDNERELHWLERSGRNVEVVCFALAPIEREESVCARTARQFSVE